MISAAFAAGLVLAGCNSNGLSPSAKASKPIPEKLLSEIESKNMDKGSPILVRLFKQEAELEVWKQDRSGQFALLKTYPICRWSGDLGPKLREGDRQAPEGFYSITPGQMNPASSFYLSFNMGYPNAYDKAWGRTGSQLMVHGDCSSRGCYAMTDEQISEIYSLGRESFFGGQSAFQVQAYPFRMTAQNMARHRDNPNMPFWKMLKQGNDYFEVTKREPKVDVCERKYVFGAEKPADALRPPVFNASAKCPSYEVPADIAQALHDKERADQTKLAELISRGTPMAKSRAGIDGGMHPIFASKLPNAQEIVTSEANDYAVASYGPAPGTIPTHVDPPKAPEGASPADFVTPTAAPTTSANAETGSGSGFFSALAAKVGLGPAAPESTAATHRGPVPSPKARPKNIAAARTAAPAPRVASPARPQQAQAQTPADAGAPSPFPDPVLVQTTASKPAGSIAGSSPALSANSFDSRWSSFR